MTDPPHVHGDLVPFLRRLAMSGYSLFTGPRLDPTSMSPAEERLCLDIMRYGNVGYFRIVGTTAPEEPVFRLTKAGLRWLAQGAVFEVGYS